MNGLLEKDIRLALQRKKALLMFIVIMFVMGMSTDGVFVVSYGTMLFGIFTVGTMSYDEYDNCFPFLLTLPVTRKEYVREKFLFCGCGVFLGWLVSMVVCAVLAAAQNNLGAMAADWAEELALWPMFLAIITVMIPLQLKYDVEKSRIVLLVLGGALFALIAVGRKTAEGMDLGFIRGIDTLPNVVILAAFVAVSGLLIAAMYRWSIRIMENKEF